MEVYYVKTELLTFYVNFVKRACDFVDGRHSELKWTGF